VCCSVLLILDLDPPRSLQKRIHVSLLTISAIHCNTLQHTATHCNKRCNTQQHTATRRNKLQHNTTHCNTLHHTAPHCTTLQHTSTRAVLQHLIGNALAQKCRREWKSRVRAWSPYYTTKSHSSSYWTILSHILLQSALLSFSIW